ncbi:MAG: hypothetical protein FWE40_07215 [Oscillospiraceae bacterium]|nr:hypothetical protein [Oscillospiraceae bacterium]
MKKLLSLLLAVLMLGSVFAVAVSALQDIPPALIAIEADWNGDIMLAPHGSGPTELFTPENLTITLVFDRGEREVLQNWNPWRENLSRWDEREHHEDWRVYWSLTGDGIDFGVTFYFQQLSTAQVWQAERLIVPAPSEAVAQFLAENPPIELTLNEPMRATTGWPNVYVFTPQADDGYWFAVQGTVPVSIVISPGDGSGGIFSSGVTSGHLFQAQAELPYHLFIFTEPGSEYTITITDVNPEPPFSGPVAWFLNLVDLFLDWTWDALPFWLAVAINLLSIPIVFAVAFVFLLPSHLLWLLFTRLPPRPRAACS